MQLSHDGRSLAWLAPTDGVLNVHVAPVGDLGAARAVTTSAKRPVQGFFWAYDSRTLVFADDIDGDENSAFRRSTSPRTAGPRPDPVQGPPAGRGRSKVPGVRCSKHRSRDSPWR